MIQSQYCVEDGLVRAELLVEVVDGGLVGERPEDAAARRCREGRWRAEEDEHAEQEERDRRQAEPLEQEPCHRASPRVLTHASDRPEELELRRPGTKPRPPLFGQAREPGLGEVELAHVAAETAFWRFGFAALRKL